MSESQPVELPTAEQLAYESATLFASLAFGRLAEGSRDLDEARLAIEALRALLPVLEETVPEDVIRDFRQVTSNLQLAFAEATRS